jgi:hypothetical protein
VAPNTGEQALSATHDPAPGERLLGCRPTGSEVGASTFDLGSTTA